MRRIRGLMIVPAIVTGFFGVPAGIGAKAQVGCHPSYRGACIPINASDVDCYGGTGNGPYYVGRVVVVGPDVFDLDRDNDGIGCDDAPRVPPGGSILAE